MKKFAVWTTTLSTGGIGEYFVIESELTTGGKADVNQAAARFPICRFNDKDRQHTRANEYCNFLNGFTTFSVTEKGLAHHASEQKAKALADEQKIADSVEVALKQWEETMKKVKGK